MATGLLLAAAAAAPELATKAWAWLGQTVIAPASYEFEVRTKTSEGFPVVLAAVYTVGPRIVAAGEPDRNPGEARFLLDAELVSPPNHIIMAYRRFLSARRVKRLIEGQVGAIATGSTLDQILYMGSRRLMTLVLDRVQPHLRELGLDVYSADVERIGIVYAPHTELAVTEGPLLEELKAAQERAAASLCFLEHARARAKEAVAELQSLLDRKRMDTNCSSKNIEALEECLNELVSLLDHDARNPLT